MLEGTLKNDYCDNITGQALGEHSDRLTLKRVTAKQEARPQDAKGNPNLSVTVGGQKEQEWIDDFWQKKKLDDLQQRVHRNTIRDGNYCLLVAYDFENEKLVLHREPWWDTNVGVFIGYDSYGNKLYAVKEWDTPQGRRRTVYYEGAVERYIASGSLWLPYLLPSDSAYGSAGAQTKGTDSIPIAYVDEDGEPMHIPFVHFSNISDEFENYGSSMFRGGKLGAQDQINDTQFDIVAAGRMTGYQRTTSCGYKLKAVAGKTIRPKTGPGVHYHADQPDAKWGVLEAGSPDALISIYKMKVEAYCRDTRTPYASITGNWPSGEALYRLEKPITGATVARQKRNAPAWVELFHRAMEISNVYERTGLDESVLLTAEYADAGDRDPLSIAIADLSFWQAAAAAVEAGMPLETFLKIAGWGEDTVKGLTTDIVNQIRTREKLTLASKQTPTVKPGGQTKVSDPKPKPTGK